MEGKQRKPWFSPHAADWVRFDEYVIENGLIGPAPGATMGIYNPWDAYRRSRERRSDTDPPYQDFLHLAQSLTYRSEESGSDGEPTEYALTPSSEADVLALCDRYGLLGLFHQTYSYIQRSPFLRVTVLDQLPQGTRLELEFVSFSPRSVQGEKMRVTYTYKVEGFPAFLQTLLDTGVIERNEENEDYLGWEYYDGHLGPEQLRLLRGELIERGESVDGWPHAGALASHGWQPLSEVVTRHFPSLSPEYPHFLGPLHPRHDESLWFYYAEPVESYVSAVRQLRDIVRGIKSVDLDEPIELQALNDDFTEASLSLETLVGSAIPSLMIEEAEDDPLKARFVQQWRFPSLLSCLAMMIVRDATEDRQIKECEVCCTLFLSSSYQAKFCSVRCRNTSQKRTVRRNQKLRAKGES